MARTDEMLRSAGKLWSEHPGILVQAHLAEKTREVREIRALFPDRKDYLYCVFHQEDASEWGRLWWARYGEGKGWSRPVRAGNTISSPGLDISAFHGPLFCVHRG